MPLPQDPRPQPGLDVVFNRAHLEHVPHATGVGGKNACQWQRALRGQCIVNNESFRDVTNDPLYDWKKLLRSAAPGFSARIIGEGIVRVAFRIIETERDPNYSNTDGHGRHFFEFVRADGSAIRLHYHKNGRPDEPTYVGPPRGAAQPAVPGAAATQLDVPAGGAAQPAVPSGGAAQPAVPRGGAAQPAVPGGDAPLLFTLEDLQAAMRDGRRPFRTVGRDEASAALQTLLRHHHGETAPGAVDITDGSAFDWLRWVAQIEGARNVIRYGVVRVYVVRWEPNAAPEAVFCYRNQTYSTLVPCTARYTGSKSETHFEWHSNANWGTDPLLSVAPVAAAPWLPLRDRVTWS